MPSEPPIWATGFLRKANRNTRGRMRKLAIRELVNPYILQPVQSGFFHRQSVGLPGMEWEKDEDLREWKDERTRILPGDPWAGRALGSQRGQGGRRGAEGRSASGLPG